MNCPTCKKHDEFVFEENIKVWRCDRCHERFIIKPRRTNCDASEEFIRVATTNADRIRAMTDEELARFLARVENRRSAAGNGAMWNGMANALDWLKQPGKEE